MRFVLRLISLFFLVIAVITGVVDAIQTVAAGGFAPTILGEAWREFSPDTLALARSTVLHYTHPYLWDPIIQWVLSQPAAAVFLALSLIFYLLGHRRRKPAGRFAA